MKKLFLFLVGKLRESAIRLASLEVDEQEKHEEDIQKERQFLNSVKQSLIAIGFISIDPLVELNRELRFSTKQTAAFEARKGKGKLSGLSQEDRATIFKRISVMMCANDEVKDVIRNILTKTSSTLAQHDAPSPLAQNRISLSNTDLSYTRLLRINLAGVDLRNADLRHSSLEEANLRNANLSGALLQESIIQEANFEGAKCEGAKMHDIKYFGRVKVKEASFLHAEINNNDLRQYLKTNGGLNVP